MFHILVKLDRKAAVIEALCFSHLDDQSLYISSEEDTLLMIEDAY